MNILVTGANGQLGNEIRILTGDSRHNYIYTDVVEAEGNRTTMLDITNAEDVKAMVANHNIDCFRPGTVAFLLDLESVFATQVVAIFSDGEPGILDLLLFAGTHGKTFVGVGFRKNFKGDFGNTI